MSNTNHTIDELLSMLERNGWKRYHAELIALVAKQDKLAEDIKWHQERYDNLCVTVYGLRKRVAELEEEGNGLAEKLQMQRNLRDLDRQFAAQPSSDRELRKDLICAALTGLCANPMHHTQPSNVLSDSALMVADNTIAKMREEDSRE